MKVGDLIRDSKYPKDVAAVLEISEYRLYYRLFWISGSTAGDVTFEDYDFVLGEFVVLSSGKSNRENFCQK